MLDLTSLDSHGAEPFATLGSAVRHLTALFLEAGIPNGQLDARILVAEACGTSSQDTILRRREAVAAGEQRRIGQFAARRLAGEPVSRITGRREFWGLSFELSPDTLDPRPETELLAEAVLDHVSSQTLAHVPLRLLDLGTGSGCLLGALLSELPQSRGIGVDRSEGALLMARKNLWRLGLRDRVSFLCADWMSAIGGRALDVIVSNPPYIAPQEISRLQPEVRIYDPRLALDGGEDGLEAYRIIVPQAFAALRKGGLLVLEVGRGQAGAVLDLMKQSALNPGFSGARILTDLGGTGRAVAGVRQS